MEGGSGLPQRRHRTGHQWADPFFSSLFLSPVLPSLLRARALIKKHEKDLHKLAKGLLEHETLTGDQIRTMFNLQQEGVKKRKEPRGVMGAQ